MSETNEMAPLTKEQKEYFDLKFATERFYEISKKMRDEGKISQCHNFETELAPGNIKFNFEQMLYKYLEVLQKEHEAYKKHLNND